MGVMVEGFQKPPFENGFGYHMYVKDCEATVYTIAIN